MNGWLPSLLFNLGLNASLSSATQAVGILTEAEWQTRTVVDQVGNILWRTLIPAGKVGGVTWNDRARAGHTLSELWRTMFRAGRTGTIIWREIDGEAGQATPIVFRFVSGVLTSISFID